MIFGNDQKMLRTSRYLCSKKERVCDYVITGPLILRICVIVKDPGLIPPQTSNWRLYVGEKGGKKMFSYGKSCVIAPKGASCSWRPIYVMLSHIYTPLFFFVWVTWIFTESGLTRVHVCKISTLLSGFRNVACVHPVRLLCGEWEHLVCRSKKTKEKAAGEECEREREKEIESCRGSGRKNRPI